MRVVITGASRGIGRATAQKLAADGASALTLCVVAYLDELAAPTARRAKEKLAGHVRVAFIPTVKVRRATVRSARGAPDCRVLEALCQVRREEAPQRSGRGEASPCYQETLQLASRSFQRVQQCAAGKLHAFCRRPRAPYSDVRFPAD